MNTPEQLAKHLRDVHFGGNWTTVNLRDTLSDVTWEEATARAGTLNRIVALAFHINYYVDTVLKVLEGGPLDAHDRFSFDHEHLRSSEDWQRFQEKMWSDAERLAVLIARLPDSLLRTDFTDRKYGNHLRNILGLIEHTHYHLGQIVVIKKMLRTGPPTGE